MDLKQLIWGSGRLSRLEFGGFIVVMILGLTALEWLLPDQPTRPAQIALPLVWFGATWLQVNAMIARLHDAGRSRWIAAPAMVIEWGASILMEMYNTSKPVLITGWIVTLGVYLAIALLKRNDVLIRRVT